MAKFSHTRATTIALHTITGLPQDKILEIVGKLKILGAKELDLDVEEGMTFKATFSASLNKYDEIDNMIRGFITR